MALNPAQKKGEPRPTIPRLAEDMGRRERTKWTEERIKDLCDRLDTWLEDPEHIELSGFWADQRDVFWYQGLPEYLASRSDRFLHAFMRAKKTEESRLIKLGLGSRSSSVTSFLEFILINKAGFLPRNQKIVDNSKNQNNTLNLPSINLASEQPVKATIQQPDPTLQLPDQPSSEPLQKGTVSDMISDTDPMDV